MLRNLSHYFAATANSTSGRRFCTLFEYVFHPPQGNERTGDIRSSWVNVTPAAGSTLLRLGPAAKWRCFGAIFQDFVRAQKIKDLSESKKFFTEVLQITNRFVLARKKFGVRCTLRNRKEA